MADKPLKSILKKKSITNEKQDIHHNINLDLETKIATINGQDEFQLRDFSQQKCFFDWTNLVNQKKITTVKIISTKIDSIDITTEQTYPDQHLTGNKDLNCVIWFLKNDITVNFSDCEIKGKKGDHLPQLTPEMYKRLIESRAQIKN